DLRDPQLAAEPPAAAARRVLRAAAPLRGGCLRPRVGVLPGGTRKAMKAEAPIGCRGAVPRLGTGLPSIVRAGFIPPGALRRRRVPGTMQASAPTEVCDTAESAVSR